METPRVPIIRPSNRRKFLVALLGGGTTLALSGLGLLQLQKTVQSSFNSPEGLVESLSYNCFSPHLRYVAMFSFDNFDYLYIWDYQQQTMVTLPIRGEHNNHSYSWSPDSTSLFVQTSLSDEQNAWEIWDVQSQEKINAYTDKSITTMQRSYWSADGSKIALHQEGITEQTETFVVLDAKRLTPLSTFEVTPLRDSACSPDAQKIALLVVDSWNHNVQIWDTQTQKMSASISLPGKDTHHWGTLSWSPDGKQIAALIGGQLHIIQVAETLTSFTLDEPNKGGMLAWSPDSRYLVIAVERPDTSFFLDSLNDHFGVWDISGRKQVGMRVPVTKYPFALAWSKDGKQILMVDGDYRQERLNWP